MNYIPNIPEIALMQTAHNEKTLVLVTLDKQEAEWLYQLLNEYSMSWGDDNQYGYRIRILFAGRTEIVYVKLTQELFNYKNIDWLLNKEVNAVSVGLRTGDGNINYFEPVALNYQGAQ